MASSPNTAKQAYREWCTRQGVAVPIFHQPWWLDAVCGDWGVALVRKDGKIVGAWPHPLEKRLGIGMSRNPILAPYLGPVTALPEGLQPRRRAEVEHDIQQQLVQGLPALPVWAITLRPGVQEAGLYAAHGFANRARQTYYLDLRSRSADDIFGSFRNGVRRSVQLAADCTIADEPDALEEFYEMQAATLSRKASRLSYSLSALQRAYEAAQAHGQTALWTARREGKIVAVQWSVWDRQCYNLGQARIAGSAGDHVPAALLWHSIRHSLSLGLEGYDFEGSMIPGIEHFFRSFSGEKKLYLTLSKTTSGLWKMAQALRR